MTTFFPHIFSGTTFNPYKKLVDEKKAFTVNKCAQLDHSGRGFTGGKSFLQTTTCRGCQSAESEPQRDGKNMQEPFQGSRKPNLKVCSIAILPKL